MFYLLYLGTRWHLPKGFYYMDRENTSTTQVKSEKRKKKDQGK